MMGWIVFAAVIVCAILFGAWPVIGWLIVLAVAIWMGSLFFV